MDYQNIKTLKGQVEYCLRAKRRGILEDEWHVAVGYPTKATTGTPTPSWTPPSVININKAGKVVPTEPNQSTLL